MHVWISLPCLKKQNIGCQIVGYQYNCERSGGETLVIKVLIALGFIGLDSSAEVFFETKIRSSSSKVYPLSMRAEHLWEGNRFVKGATWLAVNEVNVHLRRTTGARR